MNNETVSAKRAFALMEKLGYVRVSCTPEEKRAAEELQKEAASFGLDCTIEEFEAATGEVTKATFKVIAPYEKEYEVTGYIRSDSTPDEGLELDFVYVENALEANLVGVAGKAILVNGRFGMDAYERIQKAKPAAIITFSGAVDDDLNKTDLEIRKIRETYAEKHGSAVALTIRAIDALDIVKSGAKKVHILVKSESKQGISRNVCGEIKGTEFPDEIVSFGAHFDSVYFSTGVYDNMSGSAIIMELARYFMANPPKRTLKFNWYGSEEQGLLGSKAYVEAHKDELEKHRFMINVDVAAPILGKELIFCMGTEALKSYVDGMMKELGRAAVVEDDIYSSDSIPFADNGVPGINFCRFGAPGTAFIHDRRDNLGLGFMSAEALDITLQNVLEFSKRVINAPVFPIERKISDSIRGKVDKYLFKKKD